jgi:hydrogen peroxide-dependent heme synthase
VDDLTFAYYPAFRARSDLGGRTAGDLDQLAHEAEILLKEWSDRVAVRGTYSTVGFRADTDLLMWWVARSAEDVQDLVAEFRRTGLGRRLEPTHAFLGLVRPAEFSRDHLPAFLRGEGPKQYLCVYPFVRTPEWYLLPAEERSAMLREHGEFGREFPDVLANTTSAFGLSDWEWILAFEADELHRIVDCIRRLRDSASRRYVKEEVPFVVGIRTPVAEAVAGLA